MKHFLYIYGKPGVGKITVARILEKELKWRLFWFHDIKNAVTDIVVEKRIPRLMDEVTMPILRYLLDNGQSIIYVRPSADKETIEHIHDLVRKYPDYTFHPVRLGASYETLLARVTQRDDPYRIGNKEGLDDYLKRGTATVEGELVIETDELTPDEVSQKVLVALNLEAGPTQLQA